MVKYVSLTLPCKSFRRDNAPNILAVGILHAEATTLQYIDTSYCYRDECLVETPIIPNLRPFENRDH